MAKEPTKKAAPIAPPGQTIAPRQKKPRTTRDLLQGDRATGAHKISQADWDVFIALIANGSKVNEALAQTEIKRYAFNLELRGNEAARAQYEEAKAVALYTDLDMDTFEEIIAAIATGTRTLAQELQDRFIDEYKFRRLLLIDPVAKELYEEARQIQMEAMADDVLQISDDDSADIVHNIDGMKPNNAAVQRARLKANSRQWLMTRLHHTRFGDKQQIDLQANVTVDYAGTLEAARKRKEAGRIRSKENA